MAKRYASPLELPELTLRGLILGAAITLVFTASNVYLGLKVGLTFASSIPAAVISMAVLRYFSGSNILENNMVQTQASAAGTLSSVIFILPGLLMIGYWAGFPFWQSAAICSLGGILGVLYTIPLRRAMVVHSDLPYPEGVAAAEILRIGSDEAEDPSKQSTGLRDILSGGLVAAAFSLFSGGFKLFSEGLSLWFGAFRLSTGFSLALVGAGYLMGITAGLAILIGVLIAWGVAVPILTLGSQLPPDQTLAELGTQLWGSQVRFLGAGTIGVAALWTLATLFKPVVQGVRSALQSRGSSAAVGDRRLDQDLSPRLILLLAAAILIALTGVFAWFVSDAAPHLAGQAFWALVGGCVLFAFFFGFLIAAACGYMAGLVGSSSSPISGVGIIAVILVSLLILAVGSLDADFLGLAGGKIAIALALFTTAVVIATAAISNDNLQDLKTGLLVGATPWRQQVALIVGCVVGALVIPPVLDLLYHAYGFAGALPRAGMDEQQALAAPQATLLTSIASGIFHGQLNWTMILIGVALGIVLIVVDLALRHAGRGSLPGLAVGLGIYLPPTIGMTLVIGAVLGWLIDRHLHRKASADGQEADRRIEASRHRGVLLASGLIVGESLMGILMAGIIGATGQDAPLALVGADFADIAQWLGLAAFAVIGVVLYRRLTRNI